jgi:2-polyprenyl-6-methoxyphenol hydroxylase-like FAD-dependent oxidoreductase
MPAEAVRKGRAIVIGGSFAGALAARVLADKYEQVFIVERGDPPEKVLPRRNVPQAHHVHLLLQRGKLAIDRLFPGFFSELEQLGATVADLSRDIRWLHCDIWKERFSTDIFAHYCSRSLIDHVIWRRICALSNITYIPHTKVTGLVAKNGAVDGVQCITGDRHHSLMGDLVVEASGRGSQAALWLSEIGYPDTPMSTVKASLGYASRIYRRLPEFAEEWKVLLIFPRLPASRRMGVISPIEGDRWMVTTGGWFDAFPNPVEDEFLNYLHGLPSREIYDVVRRAEPLSDIATYRMPGGLRRHFEQMPSWPARFLVIGDAVCSFNPLYSQGLTICAMEAEFLLSSLDRLLADKGSSRICQEIMSAFSHIVEQPWEQAKNEDMRFPEMGGSPSFALQVRHWYMTKIAEVSAHHRGTLVALLRAINLAEGGNQLFKPHMIARVLGLSLQQKMVKMWR